MPSPCTIISHTITALLLMLAAGCSLPEVRLGDERNAALPPLEATSWWPQEPRQTRAHIIGLHSFADYHRAFEHWGQHLSHQGYAVHSYDQLGFGKRGEKGRWYGSEVMVQDALTLARQLKAERDAPVYLMGESMGGSIAILAAQREPELIDGLILAAPAVREGLLIRYPYNAALNMVAAIAPGATVSLQHNGHSNALRAASVERLAQSPHSLKEVRMDTYRGLIRLADLASDSAPELEQPVLLFYGGQDESVPEVAINKLQQHWTDHLTYHYRDDWPHLVFQARDWKEIADTTSLWLEASSIQTLTPTTFF
ncbi:MAG: alpha/beta fold hydrolase [Pseudomonadota bacterium]